MWGDYSTEHWNGVPTVHGMANPPCVGFPVLRDWMQPLLLKATRQASDCETGNWLLCSARPSWAWGSGSCVRASDGYFPGEVSHSAYVKCTDTLSWPPSLGCFSYTCAGNASPASGGKCWPGPVRMNLRNLTGQSFLPLPSPSPCFYKWLQSPVGKGLQESKFPYVNSAIIIQLLLTFFLCLFKKTFIYWLCI